MNHPTPAALVRYLASQSSQIEADTIDHHLASCPECRLAIADDEWTDRSWQELRTGLRTLPRSISERGLAAIGVPDHMAQLIATSSAFHPAWWISLAAALTFAGLSAVAVADHPLATLPFLTVAPILPVVGVALAYGLPADPLTQIEAVAPYGGWRLVLIRSMAVSTGSIMIASVLALVFMPIDHAFLWLIPSLAATATTLALATHIGAPLASAAVVTAWILVVGATAVGGVPIAAFAAAPHLVVLVTAVVALASTRRTVTVSPSS